MKKIGVLVILLASTVFSGCFTPAEDFNRYIYLELQDAILFDNNQNYVVGDTIYIELSFDRYLDEEGYSNKLDIFESSGSESFIYKYKLDRFSDLSNGFQQISIDSDFLFAEKGAIDDGGGAIALLNEGKTRYESRWGLVLAEAGRFQFDFEFLTIRSAIFLEDKVQIDIQHSFMAGQPNFEFVVGE